MKVRLGIDVACRAAHQASCADEAGNVIWAGYRFKTDPADLDALWAKLPAERSEVMVIMEPTRNAWAVLAAWFRARGASVVMIPPEQSADLRDYFNKHAKTDRLDSRILAKVPLLHPDGLHAEAGIGPGEALKRAVKIRSGLVHRRTTCMARLDALLEIGGPGWVGAIGSDMGVTALRFCTRYASPARVKRLGAKRLAEFLRVSSRGAWNHERAAEVIAAAEASSALWGPDGIDFEALAEDIAVEARLALGICEEIKAIDKRIAVLYAQADPEAIVRSAPGVGVIGAPQILGRLGDPTRFSSLSAVRSFSGFVPAQDSSGVHTRAGGPTKAGDTGCRLICARRELHERHSGGALHHRHGRGPSSRSRAEPPTCSRL
ncbi:MAG: IS110 family transposase, partial [Acidimicrobiales bacterium]